MRLCKPLNGAEPACAAGSAVATHATRLGEKLRREGLGTDHITVFYHTSGHDRG
jgi:DNA polymerase V